MLTFTLDTNCVDNRDLRTRVSAAGAQVATFSVTRKELGTTTFAVDLLDLSVLPEQTVWTDGVWADGVWGDRTWASAIDAAYRLPGGGEVRGDPFEAILQVVSNGSFPPPNARGQMTAPQRRQFRDAMLLALHAQHRRDVFVTGDKRGFLDHGRRTVLEAMLSTRIRTPAEVLAMLSDTAADGRLDSA